MRSLATIIVRELILLVLVSLVFCLEGGTALAASPEEQFARIYLPCGDTIHLELEDFRTTLSERGHSIQVCNSTGRSFILVPLTDIGYRANKGTELWMRWNPDLQHAHLFSPNIPAENMVASYWSLGAPNDEVMHAAYNATPPLNRPLNVGINGYAMTLDSIRRLASSNAEFVFDPFNPWGYSSAASSIALVDSTTNLQMARHTILRMRIESNRYTPRQALAYKFSATQSFPPTFSFPKNSRDFYEESLKITENYLNGFHPSKTYDDLEDSVCETPRIGFIRGVSLIVRTLICKEAQDVVASELRDGCSNSSRALATFTTEAYRSFGPNVVGAGTNSLLLTMGVEPKYAEPTGYIAEVAAEWRAHAPLTIMESLSYLRQRSGELIAATAGGLSAARLYSQQIATFAHALSKYGFYSAQSTYYSAINSIRSLNGALGNMITSGGRALLRPISFSGGTAVQGVVGGAVLAAPALVYAGFQQEYSQIRTEHAKSTEECQSLSHRLYWSQRQRCETQYSGENLNRSQCLERARSIYKLELQECMNEFNSGHSYLF